MGITLDATGTLYVGDIGNQNIRKVTQDGTVTTVATPAIGTIGGIAVDAHGSLYVSSGLAIVKITAAGVFKTLAGQQGVVGYTDGAGTAATFSEPHGVAVDGSFNVYVADRPTEVRKITQ